MHLHRNKKIFLYFFLFLLIGTLNNKNLDKLHFNNINKIIITGLDDKNNNELKKKLEILKLKNIFFINDLTINEIINSNNLVEKFTVFKQYPSSLNIKIDKTKFIAQVKKGENNFLLGTNGKLIKLLEKNKNLPPLIFGNFENENFFRLKKAIDDSNFDYDKIKNLFFFPSGRWDIETTSGLLIKLPTHNAKLSLERGIKFLENNNGKKIKEIDLRQQNQIIIINGL